MRQSRGVKRSRVEGFFRYSLLSFVAFTALVPAYIMFSGSFKSQGEFLNSP
ncbi:MAG: hypothetical protein RIS22_797, partial [Actinomycetota bacterium]